MNEIIVFEKGKDLFTTSDTIAEFAEVTSRSVYLLVEKHIYDLGNR